MPTEMGEYLVGAYLKLERGCDVVDYNARPPGGRLEGLGELDVIGFSFEGNTAFLCEVTTHLDGMQIGSGADATFTKLMDKHTRQRSFAEKYLKNFKPQFMIWSPVVRTAIAERLKTLDGVELYINERYTEAINKLMERARGHTYDTNNPAYRVLQILGHLR